MGCCLSLHAQFLPVEPQAIMSTLILNSPERFPTSFRRSFTVSQKLSVLESISNGGNDNLSQFARDHDISRSTLQKWINNKDDLLVAHEQRSSARRVSGGGRPSTIPDNVKVILLSFVDERRSNNLPVTPRMIYHEWMRVDKSIESLPEYSVRQRIYRFMKRNDLVIRRTTHHAQRAKNDPVIISDWILYMQETCDAYGITKDRIANFDETDVQYAVPTSSTVTYRGEKTVSVRTPVSSSRCTVMLGVTADGHKFPPYVIYKGAMGGRVAKELRKAEDHGYSGGCIYRVQPKAWMNEELMLEWVEHVWKPFTVAKGNKITLLMVDQFAVHSMPTVKKAIENCGTLLEFIPKGYTSCLQVCDIGLNKPFKDYMRSAVNEWMVLNDAGTRPDRPTVSNWINHAWQKITQRTITNTWAHIKMSYYIDTTTEEIITAGTQTGVFMDDTDPREEDILALRESYETSSDEED